MDNEFMEEINEFKDGLSEVGQGLEKLFTNNPINWLKWGIVFAVLVGGYVLIFKCKWFDRILYKWEHRKKAALSKNHVIQAKLVSKYPYGEAPQYDWHATYSYTLDGKEKTYRAIFNYPSDAPDTLELYYTNNPKRLFSVEEYHWSGISGIFVGLILFLPFVLAGFTAILLRIDI